MVTLILCACSSCPNICSDELRHSKQQVQDSEAQKRELQVTIKEIQATSKEQVRTRTCKSQPMR